MDDSVEDDRPTELKKAQKIEIMDDNVDGQSTELKKAQKIQIMKQREVQRRDKLQEDRTKMVSVKSDTEKPHYIANKFEQKRCEILSAFEKIENCPNPTDGLRMLAQCYGKLDELREMFDAYTYLLNNYHLRKLREYYRQLEEKCQQLEQRLKPRKKFGFSRACPVSVDVSLGSVAILNGSETDDLDRPKKLAVSINGAVSITVNGNKASNCVDAVDNRIAAANNNNIDKIIAVASNIVEDSVIGFRDKKCEKLRMRHDEIACKDVQLTNLQRCEVKLYGSPVAVYVASLEHCEIFCGPTLSSILVESCRNCTFVLACQQLRIHTSTDCKFYTYVTSRTIIENCKGIQFAPYAWKYDRMESHFELAYHGRPNNWQAVDDFDWLSLNVPSPNWSFIKDDETTIFSDN